MDGHQVETKAPFKKDGSAKSVIAIREGTAIVVLRIFERIIPILSCRSNRTISSTTRYTAYPAHIESRVGDQIWRVKAQIGNVELAAARDLDHRLILARQVNGEPFAAQILYRSTENPGNCGKTV